MLLWIGYSKKMPSSLCQYLQDEAWLTESRVTNFVVSQCHVTKTETGRCHDTGVIEFSEKQRKSSRVLLISGAARGKRQSDFAASSISRTDLIFNCDLKVATQEIRGPRVKVSPLGTPVTRTKQAGIPQLPTASQMGHKRGRAEHQ